jgi:GDP-4-dehydro-6-deoxy-D-mannose reductase
VKALITGAGGFVGPHLVEHLERAGDDVVPLDVEDGPDLRDHAGWEATIGGVGPEVVYHLGGWSDVGGSWHDPYTTFEVNVLGTVSILEAARRSGCRRVVVVSSADVYGAVPADELPITEEHPILPSSPYGASKQATEAAAMQYHRGYGLDVVIVRPFNHIGPGQSPRFAAPAFARQIAEAEQAAASVAGADPGPLRHGDLTPERDLTDVRDVVRAYRLLARSGRPGQSYNVCSGQSTSMATVLDTLCSLTSTPIETEIDPSRLRPVEVMTQRGSPTKLTEATGWRPTIGLEQTLADVLDDARHRVLAERGDGLRTGDPAIG